VLSTRSVDVGGLGGSVAYFDTENKFSSERLLQLARARFPGEYGQDGDASQSEAALSLAARVLVFSPYAQGGHGGGKGASANLLKLLEELEEHIIARNITLIIVDSIAALIRAEVAETTADRIKLQDVLGRQASLLKRYAETFGIPVFTTNQITTKSGGEPTHQIGGLLGNKDNNNNNDNVDIVGDGDRRDRKRDSGGGEEESYLTAALGYKWAHAVNTRLVVEAEDGRRILSIAKSPIAPVARQAYEVKESGIVPLIHGDEHQLRAVVGGSAVDFRIGNDGQRGAGGVILAAAGRAGMNN